MKKLKHINFYCVDNDSNALEYFRSRFNPDYNFTLHTFDSVQRFFLKLQSDANDKSFKIVFIDNLITSRGMNTRTASELIAPIKNIDKDIAIVIFADSDNFDLKATASNNRASAFIKKDSNFFIRLYPLISRIISEYELKTKKRSTKIASLVTLAIILLCLIALVLGMIFYDV